MSLIARLKAFKKKNDFNPGITALIYNPFYFARKGLFSAMSTEAPHLTGDLLDVGCGRKPYRSLFQVKSYVGMDIEQSGHTHEDEDIDVFYDGKKFPFEPGSFDAVLCNQVFEHVFNPEEFLQEITQVLKKDGQLLLSVPFAWDEHEQPYDYARYSSFALQFLLEKNGFKIVSHHKCMNDIRAVLQLLNMFLFKKLGGSNKYQRLLVTLIFIAPVNILGSLIALIPAKNDDLYLDNVIRAQKL